MLLLLLLLITLIITDQSFMRYVKYLIADKPTFSSDHSPICSWIETTLPPTPQINDQTESITRFITISSFPVYLGSDSKELFKAAILSAIIADQLNAFLLKDLKEIPSDKSVNMAIKMVESIFIKAACKHVVKTQTEKKTKEKT